MKTNLVITPELRAQLELLAFIDCEYVSDLVLALVETLANIKQDPEDMPAPVRKCYIYWTTDNRLTTIRSDVFIEE